jgi:hypothetical protein
MLKSQGLLGTEILHAPEARKPRVLWCEGPSLSLFLSHLLSLSPPLSPLASPSTEGEGLVEFSAMAMGGERKGTNPGRGGPSNQPRLVLCEV